MTHNSREAREQQLLGDLELKRRVLTDVAAVIEYLHRQGIVHLDIKPGNVLMRVVDG